jgi:hypothetical protein|tara:strand:+ start:30 stop:410 length:381 start_codon:yes stop_codon:yes gene_type:complete
MLPDLLNFIDENGLKIMLDLKGWKLSEAITIKDLAIVKPDFYPPTHILAVGKKGYIYADGSTRIEYAGQVFSSTTDLLESCGEDAILDFKNWVFLEEKEWVITDGKNWLSSFSNLAELPKRTKYRC